MLQFGLRLGNHPRVCVTTTPRNNPTLKALLSRESTVSTHAPTEANAANLADSYLREMRARYTGRLGRQELDGEFLADVEGALWPAKVLEAAHRGDGLRRDPGPGGGAHRAQAAPGGPLSAPVRGRPASLAGARPGDPPARAPLRRRRPPGVSARGLFYAVARCDPPAGAGGGVQCPWTPAAAYGIVTGREDRSHVGFHDFRAGATGALAADAPALHRRGGRPVRSCGSCAAAGPCGVRPAAWPLQPARASSKSSRPDGGPTAATAR